MKKRMEKCLTILLSIMLILNMMPTFVFADDEVENAPVETNEIEESNENQENLIVDNDPVMEIEDSSNIEEVSQDVQETVKEETVVLEDALIETKEEVISEENQEAIVEEVTEETVEVQEEVIEIAEEEILDEEDDEVIEEVLEAEEEINEEETEALDEEENIEEEVLEEESEEEQEELVPFEESQTIDGVIISVKAEEGTFHKDSTLSIRKVDIIEEAKVEEAIQEQREDNKNVVSSYTFDIKVLDKEGNEIQPAEGKKVEVSFKLAEVLNTNLETNVYHIDDEDNVTSLDIKENEDTAIVETDGFSYYTVEFTYNSLTYSLDGNSEVALSEILTAVGLEGTATAAVSSDSEAIEVVEEEGNFIIKSKKFFTESKTLTVTIDGTDYEITVSATIDSSFTQISGSNVYYKIDDEGTLILTGSGDMPDFTFKKSSWSAPWAINGTVNPNIKNVLFAEGSNITKVGNYAFTGLNKITSIKIPKTVTAIGNNAFSANSVVSCTSLERVTFEEGSNCETIGSKAFQSLATLKYIDIPEKLKTISSYAFDDTSALEIDLVIPNTITNMTTYAFRGSGIKSVTFEKGSDPTMRFPFESCSNLTYADLGSVTKLASDMFKSCNKLDTLIGEEVTFIGPGSLNMINVNKTTASVVKFPKVNNFDSSGDSFYWFSTKELTINPDIANTSNYSLYNKGRLQYLFSELEQNSEYTLELAPVTPEKDSYTGEVFKAILRDPQGNVVHGGGWNYFWPYGYSFKYTDMNLKPDSLNSSSGRDYIKAWEYGTTYENSEVKCIAWRTDAEGNVEAAVATAPVQSNVQSEGAGLHQMLDDLSVIMFKDEIGDTLPVLLGRASIPGMDYEGVGVIGPGEPEIDPDADNADSYYYAKITDPESSDSSIVSVDNTDGNGKLCKMLANEIGTASIGYRIFTAGEANYSLNSPIYGRQATRTIATASGTASEHPGPMGPFNFKIYVIDAHTKNITQTAITLVLEGVTDEMQTMEVTLGGQTWTATPEEMTHTFTGLTPDTEYVIDLRAADNATAVITNGFREIVTKTLPKEDQEKPEAPTAKTIGTNSIELNPIENGLYRLGEDGEWQDSPVFSGLEMDTEYTFYQKHGETDEYNESQVSDPATFRTSKHIHDWTYEAEGATITATCGNSDELHEGELTSTLTVVKPALEVYGGEESEEATLDGAIDGVTNPEVVYKKANDVLGAAPKDAGTYTANITLGDVTASVEYTIAKADAITLEEAQKPTAADLTYNGNDQDLLIAASNPLPTTHTMMYAVGEDGENAPSEDKFAGTIPTGKNAGKYYVWYYAKGDDNHESTEPVCIEVTIAKKDMTVSAAGYTGTFDEQSHSITVTVTDPASGATITYKGPNDTDYGSPNPEFTIPGEYEVAYKVTADNYEEKTGTATVKINPAEFVGVDSDSYEGVYDGENHSITVTVPDTYEDYTITYAVSEEGPFENEKNYKDFTNGVKTIYYKVSKNGYNDVIGSDTVNITKRPVTVSGITASNKVYDGNVTATVDTSEATFTDIVGEDKLTVTTTGSFSDKNVGTEKTVTFADFILGGADVGNYELAATGNQTSTTANITKRPVTISGITAQNKTYDGNTDATLVLDNAVINDKVENDDLSFTGSTGKFSNKNVGNDKTVTITGVTLSGNDAANYELASQPEDTTADITKRPVTVSGITASNKVYDGNVTATVDTSEATFTDIVGDDQLTVSTTGSFSDKNVGEDKIVLFSTLILGGASESNYKLADTGNQADTTADITPKEVELEWSETEFTYDGKTHKPTATVKNLVSGDTCNVTVTGEQTNAGTYTATASALNNDNYELPENKTAEFTIAKRQITVSGIEAENKTYDKTTDATLDFKNVVLDENLDGNNLSVTAKGEFVNADAGMFKTVNITDLELTGPAKDNYVLASEGQQTTTEANILQKYIYVKAANASKTYGEADPELTYSYEPELFEGDSFTGTLYREKGEDVKQYGIMQGSISAGNNYNIAFTTALFTINKAKITIEADDKTSIYGDEIEELSYTVSEGKVKEGDELKIAYTTGASKTANVGEYDIVPDWEIENTNYDVTFENGIYTITQKEAELEWKDIELTYNGQAQKPSATVKNLVNGDTCEVSVEGEQTNVGTYTATAKELSNSNYKLPEEASVEFVINPKELSDDMLSMDSDEFLDNDKIQSPKISMKDNEVEMSKDDYEVSGETESKESGTHFITIEGKGNYFGTLSTSWMIYSSKDNYQKEKGIDGQGDIEVYVDVIDNTESISIDNLNIEFAKGLLSEEDIERNNNGERVVIYMEVIEMNKDDVDENDRNQIMLEFNRLDVDNMRWFNILVWKKIGNDAANLIHDTVKEIKMNIEVPDEYKEAPENNERTFYLARCHDGEAIILTDTDSTLIEAASSKFSIYAIGYKDDEIKKDDKKDEDKKDDGKKGEDKKNNRNHYVPNTSAK